MSELAHIGPLTLHLTPDALNWLGSEWQAAPEGGSEAVNAARRDPAPDWPPETLEFEDVVSAVLNRMAAEIRKARAQRAEEFFKPVEGSENAV